MRGRCPIVPYPKPYHTRGVQDFLREQEAVLLRGHAEALSELRARAVAAPGPSGSGAAQAALAVHPDTIGLFITLCGPIPCTQSHHGFLWCFENANKNEVGAVEDLWLMHRATPVPPLESQSCCGALWAATTPSHC